MKRCCIFLLTTIFLLFCGPAFADATAFVTINGNPLQINVGADASFQIFNSDISARGQIFPTTSSDADMGVLVRLGGTLFSPDFANHAGGSSASPLLKPHTPWTPISSSIVTGNGTTSNPFTVVVVADAAATGLRMTLTVTYVNGENFFRKKMEFSSATPQTFDVYLGGDIYLAGSDSGIPFFTAASGIVGGQNCGDRPSYNILFIPVTPADRHVAGYFADVWDEISNGTLSNTVDSATCEDDGAALQWQNRSITSASAPVTIQAATSFGTIPDIAVFRVDAVTPHMASPGDTLTVTIDGLGFLANTRFSFGSGITVNSTNINSPTQATVSLSIGAGAALGFRDVRGVQSTALTFLPPSSTLSSGFEVIAPGRLDITPSGLIDFGNQPIGTTSNPRTIRLTNSGIAPVTIATIAINPSVFAISGSTCGPRLLMAASCQFNLTFTPLVAGQVSGSVTITSSGTGSPQTIFLSGNGLAPGRLVVTPPGPIAFGGQVIGTASSPRTIALTNSGGVAITIPTIASDQSAFAISGLTCGASLAPNATCQFNVIFTPTAAGSVSGAITITSSAVGGPQSIAVSGNGLTPGQLQVVPASYDFPAAQTVGFQSAAVALTVMNVGQGPVTLTADLNFPSPEFVASGSTTCTNALVLPSNSTCLIGVAFKPNAEGTRRGTIVLSSSEIGGPRSIQLSGVGQFHYSILVP